jgi:hypothetical protein
MQRDAWYVLPAAFRDAAKESHPDSRRPCFEPKFAISGRTLPKDIFYQHKTGDQQNAEGDRQKIEVPVDKGLNSRSECINEAADQKKA